MLGLIATSAFGQDSSAPPPASTEAIPSDIAPATDGSLPAEFAEFADLDAPRVVRLGNQRLLQGHPESALQAYEHAKTLAPDAREIDFVEGLAEYARGDYERARTLFENAATAANPALVDDAMYSVAATYHQQALQNTDDPKAKIAALEQAMSHYQTVLAHQSGHEAARDANFKAATAWRQLKQQQQQQQQQDQQPQDDKNKKEDENKDKQDQQQDSQPKDDQEEQDPQKQDQQESDEQKPDEDKQNSESDPSEDPSQEDKKKEQEQNQQQAQQSKEDVSKEQAERQLREMMQAIRDRKKKQRKEQRPMRIVPVDKDW